eukprot:TRINITY_DN4643_c0_g1_i3.p1 TRINITY_DN4643_c0_g1~~TRINITY_DN4643_c0_g1_i3.p1  ORF type:complete len:676 (+),score=186.68 TRINITY_DN4643_c0_g1_i3:204-2030(+)
MGVHSAAMGRRAYFAVYGGVLLALVAIATVQVEAVAVEAEQRTFEEHGQLFRRGDSDGDASSSGECLDFQQCEDTCACVDENEKDDNLDCVIVSSYIDYLRFFYCNMLPAGLGSIGLLIFVCWALVLAFVLIKTTEDFFCPSIAKLSERLQLSNNVAGVTLLAIGNGAPDVFASVTASIHGNPDIAISAVLGGAVFVTTIVLSIIIMMRDIKVARRPFVRDALCLLVVTAIIAGAIAQGSIYLWQAIISILLYFVFISVVIVGRMLYQRHKRKRRESLGIIEEVTEEELLDMTELDEGDPDLDDILELSDLRTWNSSKQFYESGEEEEEPSCGRSWLRWATLAIAWEERSPHGKLMFVVLSPIKLLQNLTIPSPSERDWAQPFALAFPIAAPMIVFLAYGWYDWAIDMGKHELPIWPVALAIGVVCSIVIFTTSSIKEPPAYHMVFVVFSFVMSSVWMYLLANELMCVLRALGRILSVNNQVLGLSVVAWSNSLVDLVANIMITRQGFGSMAVAACFAAPIFNLLFGIGAGGVFELLINKGWDAHFEVDFSPQIIIALSALALSVFSTLVAVPLMRWEISPKYGLYLIVLYFVFAAISLLNTLGFIFN